MPNKTEITRTETVTVGSKELNQYGDLIFLDTVGNEHKIGKKREQYFGAIQQGRTVKLSYAEYMNKEYIAEVGTAEPPKAPSSASRTQNQPGNQPNPTRTTTPPQSAPISGAEKGMIIGKSIDCFCAGLFTIGTQPELWEYIKSEISRVTGKKVN